MNRRTLIVVLAVWPLAVLAQKLTLHTCQEQARDNYPAIQQYGMIDALRDYTVSNAAKAWLPQVSVQVGADAFTNILNANDAMKQMGIDTKNYVGSASVTVNQSLYDGGQTVARQKVVKAQAEVQREQLNVTMHEVDERVEQIFFGALMLDEQLRQNATLQQDLAVSATTVKSLIKNGLANQADLDAISVEQLKTEQQADAFKASRKAYLKMLAVLTGQEIGEAAELERPTMAQDVPMSLWGKERPEMCYYDSNNELLNAQRKQLDASLRPTISLTGMGLIHSNVSDRVNRGLLLAGVSLKWNIGSLYTRKNDLRRIEVQRQQNDNLRDVFLFNNRLQNEEADGSLNALRQQVAKDADIVRLRESIRQSNEHKVRLGTESVNELVRSVNAVNLARQQQSLHELQLLQAIYHTHTINF